MAAKKKKSTRRGNAMWRSQRPQISPALFGASLLLALLLIGGGFLLQNPNAEEDVPGGSGLVLNEVMSDNGSIPPNGAGEAPDWVEVRNAGSEAATLRGCSLVLDQQFDRICSLPDIELQPDECAVIYCAGKTQLLHYGKWGAPFRLNASGGEVLTLLSNSDTLLDSVELPELTMNEVYARDAEGNWEVRENATPGADNESTLPGQEAGQHNTDTEVEISEAASGNTLYFPDETGKYYDYVELHNVSDRAVNLEGWTLSDDAAKPGLWGFPSLTLPADAYLAVHCSGRNLREDVQHLHTNFKLRAGESIYLFQPDGRLAGEVTLPELVADQAWSRIDDSWTAELSPTPGHENSRIAAASYQQERFGEALNGVHLSEIVAAPSEQDSDWVELYNASPQAVDLSDWGLSDDTSRPRRWQFPQGTSIAAGQYLVVVLTGSPSVTYNNRICADFALGAEGGYTVCLSDPQGQVQDAVYLGRQYGGIPYARYAGEDGFRYGEAVTLQAANTGRSYLDQAPMATASIPGGLHKSGDRFRVTLSAPADCRIYYTLDCTEPDETSTLYTGPIEISATTILRSRVYRDDCLPSFIAAQSYLYDVEVPDGIYVISLVADPDDLYSDERGILVKGPHPWPNFPYGEINEGANFWMDWERTANVELFTSSGELGFAQPCGIKLHGQFSRASEVKAFKVFARNEYGDNRFDYPIFRNRDYDSYQSFLLRCSGQDYNRTFMRDSVLCALAKDTSLMYQETEIGVCYLNGEYYSLFNLRERVSRFSVCQFEGWEGMEDDIDLIKANDIEKEGSNRSMERLLDWIEHNDTSTQAAYDYISQRIDIQNYIEYMAIQIYSGNGDTLNIKRYRNPKTDGKWRWVLYDLDWAFSVDTNSIRRWLDPQGMGANKYTDTTLFIGCMKNPTFREQFLRYMGEQLATTFSTENVLARFRERFEILEPLLPDYWEKAGISENLYKRELNALISYAQTRPRKLIGYFQQTLNFSDAEMQKYFGEAIEKIQTTK